MGTDVPAPSPSLWSIHGEASRRGERTARHKGKRSEQHVPVPAPLASARRTSSLGPRLASPSPPPLLCCRCFATCSSCRPRSLPVVSPTRHRVAHPSSVSLPWLVLSPYLHPSRPRSSATRPSRPCRAPVDGASLHPSRLPCPAVVPPRRVCLSPALSVLVRMWLAWLVVLCASSVVCFLRLAVAQPPFSAVSRSHRVPIRTASCWLLGHVTASLTSGRPSSPSVVHRRYSLASIGRVRWPVHIPLGGEGRAASSWVSEGWRGGGDGG